MLNRIKYSVTFNSTLKTFEGDYALHKGMTAITGANESGKSLIIELIRYSLFGAKALRTKVSAYKSIKCELDFKLEGDDKQYKVTRGGKGDTLYIDDNAVASGTKPVNVAIERLLGYNLSVFDISNACLQGQVEALSDKTPAERKRMVDKVIGLDVIDKMISDLSAKILANKKTIETLESTIREVIEPIKPEGYLPQDQLKAELEEAQAQSKELTRALAWLEANRVEEPKEFIPTIEMSLDLLLKAQKDYETVNNALSTISSILASEEDTPEVVNTNFAERKKRVQLWEDSRKYIKPLVAMKDITLCQELLEAKELKTKLANLLANKVICPDCGADVPLEASKVEEIKQKLKDLPEGEPLYTRQECDVFEHQWVLWDSMPSELEGVEDPQETLADILQDEANLKNSQRVKELLKQEKTLKQKIQGLSDLSNDIKLKRSELEQERAYKDQLDKYRKFVLGKVESERIVSKYMGIDSRVMKLNDLMSKVLIYDTQYDEYLKNNHIMTERLKEIKILEKNKIKQENARKGLQDLKPKIKMYLVPSLNKVASSLISEMTLGERSNIEIDDQFNIKVDNQSIEELSGSGKSVANLAIRLGLGTVLTNKVFSIFLADEIDAAMDSNRAAYTAECLRNLNKTIGQIILVSHQKPEADYNIELRKN